MSIASKGGRGPSRRQVLKGTAAVAGLAAGSGAITGFPTIWAQNIKDVTIVHTGPSVSAIGAIGQQATKDLGFTVDVQTVPDADMITRVLSQPETVDVADVSVTMMADLAGRGSAMAIPVSSYKWWDKVNPLFTKNQYPDGREGPRQGVYPFKVQYFTGPDGKELATGQTDWLAYTPLVYNADTLGIRPDLIGRKIETWGELFNPEFKGKTSTAALPEVGIVDSALAFEALGEVEYVDKGDMTKEEIDATIDRLIALKQGGHFRAFWSSFDQSVEMMASGEVVIQSMISPAVTEVRSRSIECEFVPLKEGYRGWAIVQIAMSHLDGLKRDCAIEYLNWMNSGWQGAFIARQGYYSAVPETAKQFLSADEWGYWYEGKPAQGDIIDPFGKVMERAGRVRDGGSYAQRMGNIAMWNCLMSESRYMNRRWNDFLAA